MKFNIFLGQLFFFLFIFFFWPSSTQLMGQSVQIDSKHLNPISFFIYESDYKPGRIISPTELDKSKFHPYRGGRLPNTRRKDDRMVLLYGQFHLPNLMKQQPINDDNWMVIILPQFYPMNLYLNGEHIESIGQTNNGYSNRHHTVRSVFLNKAILNKAKDDNHVLLAELLVRQGETAPFPGLFISSREIGSRYTFWRNFFNVRFVQAMGTVSLVLAFFLTLFFAFQYHYEKKYHYLIFAFFALLYSVLYANNIFSYDFSNSYFLEIISRTALLWSVYTLFVFLVFYLKDTSFFRKAAIWGLVPLCLLTIAHWSYLDISGVINFSQSYSAAFQYLIHFFSIALCAFYYTKKHKKKAMPFLIFYSSIIILSHLDLYYLWYLEIKPFVMITPYLMFSVILFGTVILAYDETNVHRVALEKSQLLDKMNRHLEEMANKRFQQLLEAETQYRYLFMHMQIGFAYHKVLYDNKGSKKEAIDYLFISVNPFFTKLTGLTKEQVIGKTVLSVLPETEPLWIKKYAEVAETGQSNRFENYSQALDRYYRVYAYSYEKDHFAVMFEDITEIKKTEKQLKESEKQFRSIFENANFGICLVNTQGNIIKANKELEIIFGYPNEELVGMHINKITHPDDIHISSQFIRNALQTEADNKIFEKRYYHKKGHIIYCQVASTLLRDDSGNPDFFISHVKDITSEKTYIQKVASSEEKYRLLAEHISDVIWVLNLSLQKYTYISPSIFGLRGLTVDEALSEPMEQSLAPESLRHVQQKITERLAAFRADPDHPVVSYDEIRQPRKDGSIIWVETVTRYRYAADQSVEVVGVSRNIDERKKAEMEVRKLSAAVEQSPVTIVITDVYGNIQYANPTFTRITGYRVDEALGKNPRLLKTGLTDKDIYKELWQKISGGGTWTGEFINRKKNGEIYFEQAIIAPISDGEKITNYIAVKTDITERKEQEEKINQYLTELRELNATKDKFFSIVAHDLKNPFNVLLGYSDLLKNDFADMQRDEMERIVHGLHNSTQVVYRLLDNLLTWSRSQTGSLTYQPIDFDLLAIIKESLDLISESALVKNITIKTSWPNQSNNALLVYADPNMVSTILRNLLTNAIKFTPSDKSVTISVETNLAEVIISICDTGLGISAEDQEKIFRIDARHSTKGTSGESGTGLGLILCQEFVEKNGGTISVKSQLGEGSIFSFTLPLSFSKKQISDTGQNEKDQKTPGLRNRLPNLFKDYPFQILIVEDNDLNRHLIQKILNIMGYDPFFAVNGAQALEILSNHKFDLCLLDIQLPDIEGTKLAKKITQIVTPAPVLLAMTADANIQDRQRYRSAGFFDTIAKPMDVQLIIEIFSKIGRQIFENKQ